MSNARAGTIWRWINCAATGAKNVITSAPGPKTSPASIARYP